MRNDLPVTGLVYDRKLFLCSHLPDVRTAEAAVVALLHLLPPAVAGGLVRGQLRVVVTLEGALRALQRRVNLLFVHIDVVFTLCSTIFIFFGGSASMFSRPRFCPACSLPPSSHSSSSFSSCSSTVRVRINGFSHACLYLR